MTVTHTVHASEPIGHNLWISSIALKSRGSIQREVKVGQVVFYRVIPIGAKGDQQSELLISVLGTLHQIIILDLLASPGI